MMTVNNKFYSYNPRFFNAPGVAMSAELSEINGKKVGLLEFNVSYDGDNPDYVVTFTLDQDQINYLQEYKYTGCYTYKVSDEDVSIKFVKEYDTFRMFIEDRNEMKFCFDLKQSQMMEFLDVLDR